jgi:ribonuclease R
VNQVFNKASQDYYEGKIDMTGVTFCFPDLEDDVFIPTANLNRALDKDIVKVYVYNKKENVLKEKLLKS